MEKQACSMCCGTSSLNVAPGVFRDFDSDLSDGVPICVGCGGLGYKVDDEGFIALVNTIFRLRFEFCPVEGVLPNTPIRLQKLEELIATVQDLYFRYGDPQRECYAREIINGSWDSRLRELKREVKN